jgi:hypothetical protein
MKIVGFFSSLLLLSVCMWAQAEAPPPPAAPQYPPARPSSSMHHPMPPADHEQHMQEMKAHLEKMHATLDQMKANLAKVKDPAARQEAQLNVDLWQGMVQHMDSMLKMMSDHPMQHEGMDHEGAAMKGCCAEMMKKDTQAGGCCGGNKCMQQGAEKTPPGPNDKSLQ